MQRGNNDKLSKLGQTDLVFGFWFTSESVLARLQVYACSCYDLCRHD